MMPSILVIVLSGIVMVHPSSQDLLDRADGGTERHGRSSDTTPQIQSERLQPFGLHIHYASRRARVSAELWNPGVKGSTNSDRSLSHIANAEQWPDVDLEAALSRLSSSVQLKTISWDDGVAPDSSAFYALHDHLERSFPRLHAALHRETIGGLSLLYTWTGQGSDQSPVLLLAHQDVVPADDEVNWTYPPFSGTVAGGYIWSRGTLDNKQSLMAILEAVERLITDGFIPARTVYLAFGHDEEVGGHGGAKRIADLLESRGITLATVIDEGGIVLSDFMRRSKRPVAAIGVGEKGSVRLELRVVVQGGHSSVPFERSAIGTLSRAVGRVEDQTFRARVSGVPRESLKALAPSQSFFYRLMISNMWLFRPVVVSVLSRKPETNAMIRTTIAPTTISGGGKANVLPSSASATINFRTMPGETPESIRAWVKRAIGDSNVEIRILGEPREASRPSPTSSAAYDILSKVIRESHPGDDVLIVPYLVPGGTDSRHFARIAETTYRFTPMQLSRKEVSRFHGVDERLPVSEYGRLIKSYYRLLKGLQEL